MKKKILIIASEFPPGSGGIGNHAYQLALHFYQEHFDVKVVADVIDIDRKKITDFANTIPFQAILIKRQRNILKTYFKRIFSSLSSAKDCDIIFCSGKFSIWLILLLKLKFNSKKIISIVHGTELDLKNSILKKLFFAALKKSDSIIAVSNYTKSFIPQIILNKIPSTIIPNGINIDEFHLQPNKIESFNPLQLITIGTVSERKGQENLINALPDILKVYPNTFYHIVGKPLMKARLLELAQSLNISDKIIFHRMIERNELIKILDQSTIKIMLSNHTSQGDFEGFGIAILEANAMGKPAIGSNFSGITDAIKNNFNGILVDPKNSQSVVEAITEILNNYSTYSNQSLQWAQQHDWKIIIKKYIEVLNSVQ